MGVSFGTGKKEKGRNTKSQGGGRGKELRPGFHGGKQIISIKIIPRSMHKLKTYLLNLYLIQFGCSIPLSHTLTSGIEHVMMEMFGIIRNTIGSRVGCSWKTHIMHPRSTHASRVVLWVDNVYLHFVHVFWQTGTPILKLRSRTKCRDPRWSLTYHGLYAAVYWNSLHICCCEFVFFQENMQTGQDTEGMTAEDYEDDFM